MKKPSKNMDRPDLKHLFSQDATSARVISKAGVKKKNSLKPLDAKDIESKARNTTERATAKRLAGRRKKSSKNLEHNEMEFLVSHDTEKRTSSGISTHVWVHCFLLVIGLVGSICCIWAMLYTSQSEEVVYNLGLQKVANSMENILSLLAYPVLLFTVILTAYAVQQLYLAYRRANFLDSSRRPDK